MELGLRHIASALAAGLVLLSCGREKERVIPRNELSEIYAEMFVLDQWLEDNRSLRREADTSLVYAPVLEKYGYTYDDYLNSVSFYMKDPTRYSRILRRSSEILNARLSELKAERAAMEEARREKQRRDSLLNTVRLNVDSLMNLMVRRDPCDSLAVGWDTLGMLELRFVQTSGTTYEGPALIVRADSCAAAADSLEVVAEVPVAADADVHDTASDAVKAVGLKPEKKLRNRPTRERLDVKPLDESGKIRFGEREQKRDSLKSE